jgi:hypothetical protein
MLKSGAMIPGARRSAVIPEGIDDISETGQALIESGREDWCIATVVARSPYWEAMEGQCEEYCKEHVGDHPPGQKPTLHKAVAGAVFPNEYNDESEDW